MIKGIGMKVRFYLRNTAAKVTAVNAILRYKGKKYKLPTGISVEAKHWNNKTYRANEKNYPDADAVNIALANVELKILQAFKEFDYNNQVPTPEQLRATIETPHKPKKKVAQANTYYLPFFRQYYTHANYATETYKKYNTTYNWLLRFEKTFNKHLKFDDIDLNFYDQFRGWILSLQYTPKKGEEPRYYTLNYCGSLVKCIKKVLKESGPESRVKLHNNTSYRSREFKVDAEDSDTVYSPLEELMKIHHFEPTLENVQPLLTDKRHHNVTKKIEALKTAKNKFLIGCFTALRVSDFNRLSEINIHDNFIRIKPKKGMRKNADVIIPIHPVVREILSGGFDITTPVSDQKLNKHIKEVYNLCGITQPVTIVRTEGYKQVERTRPKWQLISTHTARRSGATNMYKAGIPSISIMMITGHRTERSFLKYIKISSEENAEALAKHPFFK
jgi:integrase